MTRAKIKLLSALFVVFACCLTLLLNAKPAQAADIIPPDTGVLDIFLPPSELIVPNQLKLADKIFTFNTTTGQFTSSDPGIFTVSTAKEGTGRDQYYHVTVAGFKRGGGGLALGPVRSKIAQLFSSTLTYAYSPPPAGTLFFLQRRQQQQLPYGYKLTLKEPIKVTTVDGYAGYLIGKGNTSSDKAYVGTSDCILDNTGQFLCLKTKIQFSTNEFGITGPQYLLQSLAVSSPGVLEIGGNVAARGDISGFVFSQTANAIAIGGTVSSGVANSAAKAVNNYIDQNATKFSWKNVQPQITALFDKRTKGTTMTGFSGPTWNLNSINGSPANANQNSFSTPPEGKLWNVATNLTFTDEVMFKGSGTIAVNGNVVFNKKITCSAGTRLGIITSGTITFKDPNIGCGAYTALGGNIVFSFNATGTPVANGIFIASSSIDLPTVAQGARYTIGYDKDFGSNPTALYQELIQVVFSSPQ